MAALLLVACRGRAAEPSLHGVVLGPPQPAGAARSGLWCDRFEAPLVDAAGVADVLVRVVGSPADPDARPEVAIRDCRFQPRVVMAEPGQAVLVHDDDPILHSLMPGDRALVPHAPNLRVVPSGAGPVRLGCALHPWESAFVVVGPSKWSAVTDEHGRFVLPSLPPGPWEIELWHESLGRLHQTVTTPEVTLRY